MNSHNNPILSQLRGYRDSNAFVTDPRGLYASWNFTLNKAKVSDSILATYLYGGKATVEHLDHARKVIKSLAGLSR